jgi:hypothetical protein
LSKHVCSVLYVCPFINNLHQISAWRQSCIQASSHMQMVISITGSLYESLSLQKPGVAVHERVID